MTKRDSKSASLVKKVMDWPYSTSHRLAEDGIYSSDRAGSGHDE
jgi:hypothetical protein